MQATNKPQEGSANADSESNTAAGSTPADQTSTEDKADKQTAGDKPALSSTSQDKPAVTDAAAPDSVSSSAVKTEAVSSESKMDVDDSTTTADQEKIEELAVAAAKVSAQSRFSVFDEL